MATTNSKKKTIYAGESKELISKVFCVKDKSNCNFLGGLAEEVTEKVLRAAFIPFGDISEVQIPIDYSTEKHRGFAFIEYELPEDAQAAIDNMHDSELFGRTLRVNLAKPLRIKEGSTRPVWADEEWLQTYSGKKSEEDSAKNENGETAENTENDEKSQALKRAAKDAIASSGVEPVSFQNEFIRQNRDPTYSMQD